METKLINISNLDLNILYRVYNTGGVIAYPTDTIYGLGCNPYDHQACDKIISLKQRSQNKSLLVLVSKDFDLTKIANLTPTQNHILSKLKNMSVTVILSPKPDSNLSPLVTNNNKSIAVRQVSEGLVSKILDKVGIITSTSCNISNGQVLTDANQIKQVFDGKLDLIIDAQTPQNTTPSTIISLIDKPQLIRQGAVEFNTILKLITQKD